jgi:hypothetical protein
LPSAATFTDPLPAMCCRSHFSKGVEAPFVRTPFDRSRENRPANTSAPDAAASTASLPNVRDDRDTPLQGDETAWDKAVIWVG